MTVMIPQLTLIMAMCGYMAWILRDVEVVVEADPEPVEDFILLNPDGTLPEEPR